MKIRTAVAALFCLCLQQLHGESLVDGRDAQLISSIRQLSLAIGLYNQEYLANNPKNLPAPFPKTLSELVDAGYLEEIELTRLMSIPGKIVYFQPSSREADPNLPFLFGYRDGSSVLGFPSGEVSRYVTLKTEKSFWPTAIGVFLLGLIVIAIFYRPPVRSK